MAVGIANFQPLFQTYFPETDLPYLIPDNLPFMHMVPKQAGLSGDVIDHPFLYSAKQGYSNDFGTAATQAGTAPRAVRAALRCAQAYSFVEFFDKDMYLSQGNAAYADEFQKTVTGMYQDFYSNFDMDLHVGGNGWRGTVLAAAGATNPYTGTTLAANTIAVNGAFALETVFNPDQLILAATYSGFPLTGSIYPPGDGRAPTTVSAAVQVTAVDANARTLTLSDSTAFTASVFILQAGASGGYSAQNLTGTFIGMDSWNPYGGVPSTDNLGGVNRSIYPTKLAGYWFDGSRLSVEDAIKRLAARMAQGGGHYKRVCLMNPMDWDALDSKMNTFRRYGDVSGVSYGFESIVLQTALGRLDLVADPHQPQGFARIVAPEAYVFNHKLAVPHLVEVEGRTVEQGLNFDGRTSRLRAYGQLRCTDPRQQGIVKLPSILV